MPGSQPTVETVVRRWVMPTSGSRRAASSTSSTFIIGSPMPMKTSVVDRLDAAEVQRLVEDLARRVRLRPNFIVPVAQNVQVSGQPDCDDRQSERRPSW